MRADCLERAFQRKELVRRYDHLIAGADRLGRSLLAHYAEIFRAIAGRERVAPTVLDIGCGPGHFALALASGWPRASFHLLDRSAGMIEAARRNVRERAPRPRRFRFHRADAHDLRRAVGGRTFDVVVCRFVVPFVERPAEILGEAFRSLRPGGRLVFNLSGHNTYNLREGRLSLLDHPFYASLLRAGFEVLTPRLERMPRELVDWLIACGCVERRPAGARIRRDALAPRFDRGSVLDCLSRAGIPARCVRWLVLAQRQTVAFRRRYSRALGSIPLPGLWDVMRAFDALTRQLLVEEVYDRAFPGGEDRVFEDHDPVFVVTRGCREHAGGER